MKISQILKNIFRAIHSNCPECKDGKIYSVGYHDKPDGTIIYECDRCKKQYV